VRTLAGATLLIVDDHELLAESLSWALRAESFAVTVVAPASAQAVLDAAAEHRPDVVLLDLDLGGAVGSSLPLIGPLRAGGALVVVVTGATDRMRLAECVEAGAAGVLGKSTPFDDLVEAVREVLEHGSLITPARRTALLAELRARRAEGRRLMEPFERLTPREREVLLGLLEGQSAETIARNAYVSLATVRSQIRSILQKLAVNSQLAAVAKARDAGWSVPGRAAGSGG
jgi:DNA-binding NarL/FixJ family response regulator